MSSAHPAAPEHPRALARRRDRKLALLGTRANFLRGSSVAAWLLISIAIGLSLSAGSLVHASWLAIVTVATLLSPIAYIALRDINNKHEAARLALATGDDAGQAELAEHSTHLRGDLADFYAETRLIRHSLSDSVAPGEGVRLLWEWRRSLEELSEREPEADRLAELGIGLGPVANMLSDLEQTAALSPEQRHEAAIHLEHVERQLSQAPALGYR